MHCERRKRAHTAGAQPSSPCDASTRPTDAPQALRREKTKGSEPHAMRELERGREGKRARGKEKERERASVREASGAPAPGGGGGDPAVAPPRTVPDREKTARRRDHGNRAAHERRRREDALRGPSGAFNLVTSLRRARPVRDGTLARAGLCPSTTTARSKTPPPPPPLPGPRAFGPRAAGCLARRRPATRRRKQPTPQTSSAEASPDAPAP